MMAIYIGHAETRLGNDRMLFDAIRALRAAHDALALVQGEVSALPLDELRASHAALGNTLGALRAGQARPAGAPAAWFGGE